MNRDEIIEDAIAVAVSTLIRRGLARETDEAKWIISCAVQGAGPTDRGTSLAELDGHEIFPPDSK